VAKKQRDPERDKALSYERDRRNTFGQSTGGSRNAIGVHKRAVRRGNRRAEHVALDSEVPAPGDEDVAARLDTALNGKAPKRWDKVPDTPLGEVVEQKLGRRRVPRDSESD
jgi:hypothetical protein